MKQIKRSKTITSSEKPPELITDKIVEGWDNQGIKIKNRYIKTKQLRE